MNNILQTKCDLLAENRNLISKGFMLEHSMLKIASALVYTQEGKIADIDYLKECRGILRKNEGIFSDFRGLCELLVSSRLAQKDDPERFMDDIASVYKMLHEGKIFGSRYMVLAAISICDEFLPNKQKIVSIEGSKVRTEVIYASRKGDFENGKVAILIDDFSASASEIVAGAIQDNDRGIIVGRRSFGKGLVQRQFDLSDKSSIRLTTSRYHTPSGRCIQRDYENGTEAYYEDLYKRLLNGEMESLDSIHLDSTKVYHTVKGRKVYGGGGIMPDFFVPIDRNDDLNAYYDISNSSALIQFAFHYANEHKSALKSRYSDSKSYVKGMTVSDQMLQQLVSYYEKNNKKKVSKMSANSSKELKLWLKALIGRNLYGDEAFYPVINKTDKVILKALEQMK